MTYKIKRNVIKLGTSLAITIPKDLVEHLEIKQGDKISIIPVEDKNEKSLTIIK